MKWVLRLVIFLTLLELCLDSLAFFGVIDLESWLENLEIDDDLPYDANRAGTNPYRDLPANQAVLDTIKEGRLPVQGRV